MKSIQKTLALAVTLLALNACQDPIKIKLDDQGQTKLVVDGWMNAGETAEVHLNFSVPYLQSGDLPACNKAVVTLHDGVSTDTLNEQGNTGVYANTTMKGEMGKVYTLRILTADGKEYLSINSIPRGVTMDSIYFLPLPFGQQNGRLYTNFSYQENPGRGDCYWARFYRNDTSFFEATDLYSSVTDDLFIDGQHPTDVGIGRPVRPGDKVRVEAYSISQECYQFMYRLLANTAQQQNFSAPPPPSVIGNISNGALGFFRLSSKHSLERVVP